MHHHHSTDCVHGCSFESESSTHSNKVRLLWTALVLVGCFSLFELAVGFWSHSLALVAESEHMISDSLALGLALVATWISRSRNSDQANNGYGRVEILSALANGIGLVAIAVWIAWEAITRLQSPPVEILSLPMLITASVGLGVNLVNALLLHSGSQHDLNLRAAFLHMVADVISSVGVIVAAIAVWVMHWLWADGVISLFVSGLIFLGAIPLIVQSLNILLNKPVSSIKITQ